MRARGVPMKREDWERIVDNHREDDSHAICDACLILPEMYDRLVELEARPPSLREAVQAVQVRPR